MVTSRESAAGSTRGVVRHVVVAVFPTIGASLPIFLVATLAVQIRAELGFSEAGQGLVLSAGPAMAALSGVALGRFVQRVGPGRGLWICVLATTVLLLGVATAANGLLSLVILVGLCGVAPAIAQPAGDLYLVTKVDPGRRGIAFAAKQSGPPLASLAAALMVPTVGETIGWRWAFVMAAVLAAAAMLVLPGWGWRPTASDSQTTPRPQPSSPHRARGLRRSIRSPLGMAVLGLGAALGAAGMMSMLGFAVTSMVAAGMTSSAAATVFGLSSIVGIGARLRWGHVADRRQGGSLQLQIAGLLAVAVVGYLLFASGHRSPMMLATPFLFATAWGWPGLFFLSVTRLNVGAEGSASGIALASVSAGAVVGPPTFGVLASGSYAVAWIFAAACSGAAALAMIWGRRLLLGGRRPLG